MCEEHRRVVMGKGEDREVSRREGKGKDSCSTEEANGDCLGDVCVMERKMKLKRKVGRRSAKEEPE